MLNYKEYLYEVAQAMGCELRLGPNMAGMMYVEFGYVEGPDPDTSTSYTPQQSFAVGLHELGHFHHGHTQGRPPMGHLRHYFDNGVLRSEAEAWEFALEHFALLEEEIEPKTREFMNGRCIGSYYAGALASRERSDCRLWNGNRHHVQFKYDKADDFFFGIRSRLVGEENLYV